MGRRKKKNRDRQDGQDKEGWAGERRKTGIGRMDRMKRDGQEKEEKQG
jgi:hypothetical protein